MRHLLLVLIGLSICMKGLAQEPESSRWLNGKADGWFWYKTLPEEEVEEEVELKPAVPPSPPQTPVESGPAPLSSAWIRENMQAYLDAAIDNPSPENISAFLYIQRYAMDKSFAFMDAQQQTTLGHPVFDEINRRPTATFANRKLDDLATLNSQNVITKITSSSGLFFFFDGSEASMAQLSVLDMLEREFDIDLLRIAVTPLPDSLKNSGIKMDAGHSEQMGVTSVPAIVLIRSDGVFDIISQAPVSLSDLKKRVLVGAKRLAIISDEEFNSTRPIANIQNNIASSDAFNSTDPNLPIPPKEIVNAFNGGTNR